MGFIGLEVESVDSPLNNGQTFRLRKRLPKYSKEISREAKKVRASMVLSEALGRFGTDGLTSIIGQFIQDKTPQEVLDGMLNDSEEDDEPEELESWTSRTMPESEVPEVIRKTHDLDVLANEMVVSWTYAEDVNVDNIRRIEEEERTFLHQKAFKAAWPDNSGN